MDEILATLAVLPPDVIDDLKKKIAAAKAAEQRLWTPTVGKQMEAYYSKADQLLYGGEAGGGKTEILIGLALQEHKRSLLLRRHNKEVGYLSDRMKEITGHSDGYNGQDKVWHMADGRFVQFGGCQHPGDEKGYKGQPKDFIGFDEASEFLESQVDFIIGWLRSIDPKQNCRVVLATNPPTTAEGEWIIKWFAPWVDKHHELYPWPEGELLWFVREGDGFRWLHRPDPIAIDGREVQPLSRTFIRSGLRDNPDLGRTNYKDRLAQLPEPLRRAYEQGEFGLATADDQWQVIPTEWVTQAQNRWTDKRPDDAMMTAIGVDIAQGGADRTVLAPRYGAWFAPLIVYPGDKTPDGPTAAALIISHMRDGAQINLDIGGGWGGSARDFLKDNDLVSLLAVNPANASTSRALGSGLAFRNKRAELWWRMREALDPSSEDKVALPPDRELRAELCAPRWRNTAGGILIEDKLDIRRRLGRSPDKGDAVTLAWYSGSLRQKKQRGVLNLPRMTNEDRRYDRRMGPPGSGYSRGRGHRQETNGGWRGQWGSDDQA
jgi:hypothetical protein